MLRGVRENVVPGIPPRVSSSRTVGLYSGAVNATVEMGRVDAKRVEKVLCDNDLHLHLVPFLNDNFQLQFCPQ